MREQPRASDHLLSRGGLRASHALSCFLLPLSLLLNLLGVHETLILMLQAKRTDARRLIWTRSLKNSGWSTGEAKHY